MELPFGLLLADVFVTKLENGALRNTIGKLFAYCRYVDYIPILVDQSLQVQTLMEKFNQVHSALSFTSEEEWENSSHLLDVKFTKTANGKLTCQVYRKPT